MQRSKSYKNWREASITCLQISLLVSAADVFSLVSGLDFAR